MLLKTLQGVKTPYAVGNKIIITIATSPAPDETPIIPGSASGFLITPCNNAPDAAKHVPTINPTSTLGIRKSHTIRWTVEFSSCIPVAMSCNEKDKLPAKDRKKN